MKIDCFQKFLEEVFYSYGKTVAKYPLPFIIVPVILSGLLGCGLLNIQFESDSVELYTPVGGPAKKEKAFIENTFPQNDTTTFIPTRRTSLDGALQIIVKNKTYKLGNVYTKKAFEEIIALDKVIKDIKVEYNGKNYSYSDVCASWNNQCYESTVLKHLDWNADFFDDRPLNYPFHERSNYPLFIGNLFGGVTTNENNLTTAEAFYLPYLMKYQTEEEESVSNAFLRESIKKILQWESDVIEVECLSSLSLDDELVAATKSVTVLFSLTYTILSVFASVSCMMMDPVRSKFWVAFGGEIAASLAILSGFGFMSLTGIPFATTIGSVPFLIMGIGIDDVFVLISSWRHTSYTLPVEERMGKTLQKAAVSITLTSVTNALAFGIGAYTRFKAITYFCAYAGISVLFCYIYAITFCAGCLAYSGKIESQNRHSTVCCIIMKTKDRHVESKGKKQSEGRITGEKLLSKPNVSKVPPLFSTPLPTELIRDHFSNFLLKPVSKFVVIIMYLVYLGFAIWGCILLEEGLQVKNLAPDSSYAVPFYEDRDHYFDSKYGPQVMVVFTDKLDYSNPSIQHDIQNELEKFRNGSYFQTDDKLSTSWLARFKDFLSLTHQNPPDEASFIDILQNQFLQTPGYDIFKVDINFTYSNTEIQASRFMIQANGVSSSLNERDLMLEARQIASESEYNITVFSARFIFYDQYVVILHNTLQNLGIAVASMILVSVLLLPSISAVLFVTLCVVSICSGVIGYMVFWDVNLDSISMINLIMCIGFSVDFSAHISYHFCTSLEPTKNEKAKDALTDMGWPIIQGALSTILGVVVLAASDTYVFRTFFKIMLLVMLFGFFHAFFVLPVVLSLFGFSSNCSSKEVTINQPSIVSVNGHSPTSESFKGKTDKASVSQSLSLSLSV